MCEIGKEAKGIKKNKIKIILTFSLILVLETKEHSLQDGMCTFA